MRTQRMVSFGKATSAALYAPERRFRNNPPHRSGIGFDGLLQALSGVVMRRTTLQSEYLIPS